MPFQSYIEELHGFKPGDPIEIPHHPGRGGTFIATIHVIEQWEDSVVVRIHPVDRNLFTFGETDNLGRIAYGGDMLKNAKSAKESSSCQS